MIFQESNKENFKLILPIITSHNNDEQLQIVSTQLQKEFEEIGSNRIIFVALNNEEAVAMVQLVLKNADNNLELANGNEICHVHNLQVRKDLQRQGIGRELMTHVEKQATLLKKKIITLGVDGDNERAIKLYKNRNYKIFKTEEGRTPDEVLYLMKKEL